MIKYIGTGFLPDIPARDLSDDEFNALTKEQQAAVLSSGLYQAAQPGRTAQKASEDAPAVKENK
jgi:hypothetical protein